MSDDLVPACGVPVGGNRVLCLDEDHQDGLQAVAVLQVLVRPAG